jgi:hypothetical protein
MEKRVFSQECAKHKKKSDNLPQDAGHLLLLHFGPHVLETVYTSFEQSIGV